MSEGTPQKPQALPPEMAALMGEAAALGQMPGQAPADPAGMPPAPAAPSSLEEKNRMIIATMLEGFRDMAMELGEVQAIKALDKEKVNALANIWAPVLSKRSVNLAAVGGDHMDLIMAAITTFSIARPIIAAVQLEYKQKAALALKEPAQSATEMVAAGAPKS